MSLILDIAGYVAGVVILTAPETAPADGFP
jgi:hypothetical protein